VGLVVTPLALPLPLLPEPFVLHRVAVARFKLTLLPGLVRIVLFAQLGFGGGVAVPQPQRPVPASEREAGVQGGMPGLGLEYGKGKTEHIDGGRNEQETVQGPGWGSRLWHFSPQAERREIGTLAGHASASGRL
jgi:hypothetical protein